MFWFLMILMLVCGWIMCRKRMNRKHMKNSVRNISLIDWVLK